MIENDRVNILLVDDQPSKLLSYEVVLRDLGETVIKATSAREALEHLLRSEIAVILIDVCMPDLDGFQLASMIREHPRFQQTAIIFVSAVLLNEVDFLRGYEMGAVDYVPVPVIPDVLRAKVKVFAELYRKTRQLEQLNAELETRVRERTAELEASTTRLLESEQRRNLALAAGQMGSWDWDLVRHDCMWDEGQYRIFGVDPNSFKVTVENVGALIDPEDWLRLQKLLQGFSGDGEAHQAEFRIRRPNGEVRWCMGTASARVDAAGRMVRVSGVTVDITERKRRRSRHLRPKCNLRESIPVTVPGVVKRGDGLHLDRTPMTLEPAPADMSARLSPAYDILDRGVADRAFPGGVLAVGHHDRLAVHPFGRLTYERIRPQ